MAFSFIPKDIKEDLKKSGLWDRFVAVREDLKSSGLSPSVAKDRALDEFMPLLDKWRGEHLGTGAAALACCPDARSPVSLTSADTSVADAFSGKSATVVDAIRWVASHLDVSRVDPFDAPSAEAWGMLCSYSRNSLRKDEFWDKIFIRLVPSRAQLESKGEGEVDGMGIIEAIGRILEIKKKVVDDSDSAL